MKQLSKVFYAIAISVSIYNFSNSMVDNQDLSQEEIVARILDCHEHSLTNKQPILVNDKISFWRKYYGICPAVNVVVNSFLDKEESADAAINHTKNRVKNLGGSVQWQIFPTTMPHNITEILEKNGFQLNYTLTIMIYYLDGVNSKLSDEFGSLERSESENLIDSLISVKPLDIETIPAWTRILGKAHGCEWCTEIAYKEYIERGVLNRTGKPYSAEYYAGYLNDQLAGTIGLFIGNDYGHIYVTSTDESFRRKKVATQMTLTILKRAKELGLKYIILECAESIIPLYIKIGFKETFEIKNYCFNESVELSCIE